MFRFKPRKYFIISFSHVDQRYHTVQQRSCLLWLFIRFCNTIAVSSSLNSQLGFSSKVRRCLKGLALSRRDPNKVIPSEQ